MRKKQMIAILQELDKENDFCRNIKQNAVDMQKVYETLAQCQEKAIRLGSALEEKGRQAEVFVHILEDYCELIYQLGQNLQDRQFCIKSAKKIGQMLNKIRNEITYNFADDKKEVVFFPYNASMWDSLEGIWREYERNIEYDTYVVPIPYYDKNSDGSVKEWHYEGNDYPDYVPITSWEEYDLPTSLPDKIYIHNPYDQYNFVTSVHPQYYSSELKKYTNELIYVPYFVIVGKLPEHFAMLPAVLYADKVIVESQEVRDSYVKIYMQFVGERHRRVEQQTGKHDIKYWVQLRERAEQKFVVRKSPKIQKVQETNRDNVKIPEEWRHLIQKKDGTSRKVLLYNITIDSLLNHRKIYLQKLVSVLRFMKQQEDLVLLWRPHPLFLSSMEAMIPQLADAYRQIVADYKAEGWGIFDDTADLHRAIAISDAYYGDWSSVVALYQETGKPIMIQELREDGGNG